MTDPFNKLVALKSTILFLDPIPEWMTEQVNSLRDELKKMKHAPYILTVEIEDHEPLYKWKCKCGAHLSTPTDYWSALMEVQIHKHDPALEWTQEQIDQFIRTGELPPRM